MENITGKQLKIYIRDILKEESIVNFTNKLGSPRQYISDVIKNNKNLGIVWLDKIKKLDPKLNLNWLIYGQGNVYLNDSENMVEEEYTEYKSGCCNCDKKDLHIEELRDMNALLKENLIECKSKLNVYQNSSKKGKAG